LRNRLGGRSLLRPGMDHTLHQLRELFWGCLIIGTVFASLSFIAIKRKHVWMRFLDADAAMWQRLGWSKLGFFDRNFGQSRFFTFSLVFFTIAFLLLAVAATVLYLHLSHQR
jgi:hypothetical protein